MLFVLECTLKYNMLMCHEICRVQQTDPHRFNEEETAQDRVNLRRLKRVPTIPAAAHGNAFECITHGSRFLCVLATVIGTISTYLVPKVPAPRGFAILRSVNRTPV
ncbi:hypothetical protein V1478_002912 [Vespula squamosa]|uniref:Uncharacterized protein n=1 Tax=Vespula squamosa TaxID=30214 RepID=A0ABD2BR78_VESSQ